MSRARSDPGDDLADETDRVALVHGDEIREPRLGGVHRRAAERLVVDLLAGGHLDQWRPTEKDLRPALHEDRVVGHAGDVGAARRRVAEHDGECGNPGGGEAGEIAEDPPAGDEDLGLGGQVGAAGLHEVDHR